MANRTAKDAKSVHGTNPQYLIEKIIRSRIYETRYWKEQCFALNAELLVERAQQVRFIGGSYGGSIKPTPFLCLTLKMLQIQPDKEIIIEMIRQSSFKYIRVLAAFYWRLVATSVEVYTILEPLLNDFRKLKRLERDGSVAVICVDEFVDALLHDDRVCEVILPRIQKRYILESQNELEPRVSALDEDLENASSTSSDEADAAEADTGKSRAPPRREKSNDVIDKRDVEKKTKRQEDSRSKRREETTKSKEKKRRSGDKSSKKKQSKGKASGEEREEGEAGSSSDSDRSNSPTRRKRSRSRSASSPRARRRRADSPPPRHRNRDRSDSDRRRNDKRKEHKDDRDRGRKRAEDTLRSRRSRTRSRSRSASRDRRRDRR